LSAPVQTVAYRIPWFSDRGCLLYREIRIFKNPTHPLGSEVWANRVERDLKRSSSNSEDANIYVERLKPDGRVAKPGQQNTTLPNAGKPLSNELRSCVRTKSGLDLLDSGAFGTFRPENQVRQYTGRPCDDKKVLSFAVHIGRILVLDTSIPVERLTPGLRNCRQSSIFCLFTSFATLWFVLQTLSGKIPARQPSRVKSSPESTHFIV